MKKYRLSCFTFIFFFFSAAIGSAEETKSQRVEQVPAHQFKLAAEEGLTGLEKNFVAMVKEKKGIYRFGSLYVIALGPMPNPGYGLVVEKQEQMWEQINVYVKRTFPEKGKIYPHVITYPYIVGRLDLPPYTTFSVLDEESKKPLFGEESVPIHFKKKQFILDPGKVWTVDLEKALTASEMKNYTISISKMGESEETHPVKLQRDKKKKTMVKVKPLKPYQKGFTYFLQIENLKSGMTTIVPFEVKSGSKEVQVSYEFEEDLSGWTGHFSDLPANYSQDHFELDFGHRAIPLKGEKVKRGLLLSGINRSDDLFMYAKKKVGPKEGLLPNTSYLIELELEFYTNVDPGLIGAGGSPGESVYVKAGASSIEPKEKVVNGDLRMNIDKGEQSSSGVNAMVIGHIAKQNVSNEQYELKKAAMTEPVKATTNSKGELWVFFGTDSGFEGRSTLYYSTIKMNFTQNNQNSF